jgi:hypothetical protein
MSDIQKKGKIALEDFLTVMRDGYDLHFDAAIKLLLAINDGTSWVGAGADFDFNEMDVLIASMMKTQKEHAAALPRVLADDMPRSHYIHG